METMRFRALRDFGSWKEDIREIEGEGEGEEEEEEEKEKDRKEGGGGGGGTGTGGIANVAKGLLFGGRLKEACREKVCCCCCCCCCSSCCCGW